MTSAQVLIRGLPLPRQIQDTIEGGTWALPSDAESIERVFTEVASAEAKLYAVKGMISETEAWANESEEQLAQYGGPGSEVGDYLTLAPGKSVLIGDLGFDCRDRRGGEALQRARGGAPRERPFPLHLLTTCPNVVVVNAPVSGGSRPTPTSKR